MVNKIRLSNIVKANKTQAKKAAPSKERVKLPEDNVSLGSTATHYRSRRLSRYQLKKIKEGVLGGLGAIGGAIGGAMAGAAGGAIGAITLGVTGAITGAIAGGVIAARGKTGLISLGAAIGGAIIGAAGGAAGGVALGLTATAAAPVVGGLTGAAAGGVGGLLLSRAEVSW